MARTQQLGAPHTTRSWLLGYCLLGPLVLFPTIPALDPGLRMALLTWLLYKTRRRNAVEILSLELGTLFLHDYNTRPATSYCAIGQT